MSTEKVRAARSATGTRPLRSNQERLEQHGDRKHAFQILDLTVFRGRKFLPFRMKTVLLASSLIVETHIPSSFPLSGPGGNVGKTGRRPSFLPSTATVTLACFTICTSLPVHHRPSVRQCSLALQPLSRPAKRLTLGQRPSGPAVRSQHANSTSASIHSIAILAYYGSSLKRVYVRNHSSPRRDSSDNECRAYPSARSLQNSADRTANAKLADRKDGSDQKQMRRIHQTIQLDIYCTFINSELR